MKQAEDYAAEYIRKMQSLHGSGIDAGEWREAFVEAYEAGRLSAFNPMKPFTSEVIDREEVRRMIDARDDVIHQQAAEIAKLKNPHHPKRDPRGMRDCPFCGEWRALIVVCPEDRAHLRSHQCRCAWCDSEGPPGRTEAEAISFWNGEWHEAEMTPREQVEAMANLLDKKNKGEI